MMKMRQILIQYEIEHNLSHDEMIDLLQISRATFFRLLSGKNENPKRGTLERISKNLGIDVESMLNEDSTYKPLIGNVKAGYDLYADQNIERYIEVGVEDAKSGDYFLRVVGDSMIDDNIFEDDLIYVQQTPCISDGQIGIVMIGDEVTIKRVYFKDNMLILKASNEKYAPKHFTMEEVEMIPIKIIGLAKFIRRDLI